MATTQTKKQEKPKTTEQKIKHKGFEPEKMSENSIDFETQTNFPEPIRRHRLLIESTTDAAENSYYWIIDHMKYVWGYNNFKKITDAFSTSQMSSFFGVSEQRLGLQQDKVSQYLRGISEMIKSLFQLVQELRKIDERLDFYENSLNRKTEQEGTGSEITLKGIWIDNVEGGSKSPASVYGLANEVGFSTLPDLFFRVRANDKNVEKRIEEAGYDKVLTEIIEDINKNVDTIQGFNLKVKEILKRKLTQYYVWKLRTHKELKTRKNFTIKYLKQHYETIKLYIGWIKPYLKNIKHLTNKESSLKSADLISSFEGAALEIELICTKKGTTKGETTYYPVIVANWYYRTRPSMDKYTQDYQRGTAHTGFTEITLRGYVWTEKDIEDYTQLREEEELELLGNIDQSLKDALDSIGDDLKNYLKETETPPEPTETQKPKNKLTQTFDELLEPIKGFKELTEPLIKILKPKNKKTTNTLENQDKKYDSYNKAKKELKLTITQVYNNFKKTKRMATPMRQKSKTIT